MSQTYNNFIEVPTGRFSRLYACIQSNGAFVHEMFPGLKNQHFSLNFEDGCHANIRLVFPKDVSPCQAYVTWYDQDHNEIADICYGQSLGPFRLDRGNVSYVCEVAAIRKLERLPENIASDFLEYCSESKFSAKDIHKIIKLMEKQLKREESLAIVR